jgi:hypothetical protein
MKLPKNTKDYVLINQNANISYHGRHNHNTLNELEQT